MYLAKLADNSGGICLPRHKPFVFVLLLFFAMRRVYPVRGFGVPRRDHTPLKMRSTRSDWRSVPGEVACFSAVIDVYVHSPEICPLTDFSHGSLDECCAQIFGVPPV